MGDKKLEQVEGDAKDWRGIALQMGCQVGFIEEAACECRLERGE